MIQRIQTVYLFLAVLAVILVFFFPMAVFLNDMAYLKFYVTGIKNMAPDGTIPVENNLILPLAIGFAGIGILALLSVFLYKNRPKQIQFTQIAIFLNILAVLVIFFIYMPLIERKTMIKPDFSDDLGIYLPVVSLLFLVLANRSIKRDDRLVRSVDRLR